MQRRIRIGLVLVFLIFLMAVVSVYLPSILGEVVYPLEYRDLIKKYAAKYNVHPNLVAAIIFAESGFSPLATSRAGARGLMQIMPSTGRAIAQRIGEAEYTPNKLYDPDRNIEYGTYYIKSQIDGYGGNIDLGLAAYNAGRPRVDRYAQSRGYLPFETQGYVRKVKNNLDNYNRIYNDWHIEKPPPTPEIVLPPGTAPNLLHRLNRVIFGPIIERYGFPRP